MAIFRQYIAPLLIVLVFLFALVAVGIRSFLPADMAAPAPIEDVDSTAQRLNKEMQQEITVAPDVAGLPPSLEALVHGLPDDRALGTRL
jgi:hypothetical protein